jgi:hypothetical protein
MSIHQLNVTVLNALKLDALDKIKSILKANFVKTDLNYYKSNVAWNDEYIKETYIIMLNDNTESVTTFDRVVANESDIKDVVTTVVELPLNQETTKNKL